MPNTLQHQFNTCQIVMICCAKANIVGTFFAFISHTAAVRASVMHRLHAVLS